MHTTLQRLSTVLFGLLLAIALGGCATTSGTTPQEKRKAVLDMRSEVLTELYKLRPSTRAEIAAAPGYAVFSNVNINVIFASFGGGYGVVRDNRSGRQTYMKMGEAGIGLGLGAKDFRAVFVFRDRASLDRFINSGWEFGGHADAAAKAGDKGAAVGGEALFDGITVYQITQSGLALQATVKGMKYWKDDELN
ncbi:MAG: YSC84-related protein [Rhodocyclaceae bacterium]|jgi:lipid-binding SYLF domain-containing protein|nr:YSC84-related protein [Rhodocyclaceae bacterium]MDP2196506.1 YSC84-related protein [Rhodocyclaceae bacterium]MDP3037651.1 YSC84-related protein [Rhodocyclaceae bacterium]